MSDAIWFIGLIHVTAYAAIGTTFALVWLVWKAHVWTGLLRVILQWHFARSRWDRRGIDGLSDAEWQRGKPRP